MRYFKYLLALVALTATNLSPALAQSVGTYTESANSNTVKNAVGVTIVSGTVAQAGTATPADATSNTNVNASRDQSFNMVYNGTTWDMARGDANGVSTTPGRPATYWRYTPPTGGYLNSTAGVTVKAAAGAGVRNYIWSGECWSETLGAATEIEIRDGAAGAAMWRSKISTAGLTSGFTLNFNPPLQGTANTLVEFAGTTASVTGAIYCSFQGTTGP